MAQGVKARTLNGNTLAYLGDGVFELMVREYLICNSQIQARKLHLEAQKYVSANSQAKFMKLIEPLLTTEELRYAKLGRNARLSPNKKSSPQVHSSASALESLFGFLYIEKRTKRMDDLLQVISNTIEQINP